MTDLPTTFVSPTSDVRALQGAAIDLAAMASAYFQQIQALSRTACLSTETEHGANDSETLVQIFGAIGRLAAIALAETEEIAAPVGCLPTDLAYEARQQVRVRRTALDREDSDA